MNKSQEHAQFVMRNEKANFPDVTSDNLQAWYDVKGKKDTDFYKDTLIDLSGNGKDATLHNFAFEKRSGYLDDGGLIFDDVDDKLVYPSVKDEVEYTSASRNLFDKSYVVMGKYHNSPGTLVNELTSSASTQFIRVKQGVPYIWGSANKYNIIIMTFDSNKNPIERIVAYTVLSMSFSGNVEYVQVSSYQKNYDFNDFQFEEGSTATPYTPYVPLPVMTYQYNGNILSYEADGTVKRVDDGKVIERKGINLVRNGNFADGMKGWMTDSSTSISTSGYVKNTTDTSISTYGRINQHMDVTLNKNDKVFVKTQVKVLSSDCTGVNLFIRNNTISPLQNVKIINNPSTDKWLDIEGVVVASEDYSLKVRLYIQHAYPSDKYPDRSILIGKTQLINLTEAYGAGNEPTLEYIQSHPEEFAWTPNPNDLIEANEIKNNLVGDLEDLHGTGDKTEILSGTEIFTDKADDSVVHVDIDGKSMGGGSGKNLLGSTWSAYAPYNTIPEIIDIYSNTIRFTKNANGGPIAIKSGNEHKQDVMHTLSGYMTKNGIPVKRSEWASSRFDSNGVMGTISVDDTTGYFAVSQITKSSWNIHAVISSNIGDIFEIKNFQFEEGSNATSYEPPAPTPDYPIAIHSFADRNLLDTTGANINSWLVGSEVYPNPTNNAFNNSTARKLIKVTSGEILTLVKDSSPIGADNYWRLSWLDQSFTYVARTVDTSNQVNVAVPSNVSYLWVSYPNGTNPRVYKGTDTSPANFDVVSSVGKRNILLYSENIEIPSNTRYVQRNLTVPIEPNQQFTISIDSREYKNKVLEHQSVLVSPRHTEGSGIGNAVGTTFTVPIGGSYTGTFTNTNQKIDSILFYGADVNTVTENHQFYKGVKVEVGTNTSYSQAPEEIQPDTPNPTIYKTNILLNEPLRSVDDVKDRLFRDSDGLWKIERNVGERIVDGSGSFLLEQRLTNSYVQIYMNTGDWNKKASSATRGLSDRFLDIQGSVHNGNITTMGIYTHNGYNVLRFKISLLFIGMTDSNSNAEIVSAFKNWLGNNNTKVIYELANPTIETLDKELQDKLNNLRSFQDSNYLYTIVDKTNILPRNVRDNLKPNLNAKFRKLSWFWSRLLFNQLKIWSKNLTDDELIHEYKINKRRWGM